MLWREWASIILAVYTIFICDSAPNAECCCGVAIVPGLYKNWTLPGPWPLTCDRVQFRFHVVGFHVQRVQSMLGPSLVSFGGNGCAPWKGMSCLSDTGIVVGGLAHDSERRSLGLRDIA